MLSVVIPAYNEKQNIKNSYMAIATILQESEIPFELIYVDDGSKDSTWVNISALNRNDDRVRGIRFSRNFGKEAAIFAGMEASKGDCVVVIDCDLQHPPEKIIEMYELWQAGFEIVEGVKRSRGEESAAYSFAARMFYRILTSLSGIDMEHSSDFKLLDRKAVNVLLNMNERNAFFRALSSWIGFRTTTVEFDVRERTVGNSKWSTASLFRYALGGITSFTTVPLQIVTILGAVMLVLSVVLGLNSLLQKFRGVALGGFTTVIIIQLFTGSIIMISLGLIGIYIAKIYEEVQGRPRYIKTKEI